MIKQRLARGLVRYPLNDSIEVNREDGQYDLEIQSRMNAYALAQVPFTSGVPLRDLIAAVRP